MGRYRARLYLLFIFLMLTVGCVGYLVLVAQQNQENQIARLQAAYDRLQLLDEVSLALVDAETGERGFIITGEEAFLQPYHLAKARMDGLLSELRDTLDEGSANASTMSAIEKSAGEILAQLDRVIETRRADGEAAAVELVRRQLVKQEMDQLRKLVREWMAVESEELAAVSREVDRAAALTEAAIVIGFSLSVLFLILTLGLIRRETRHREKALVALTDSGKELEEILKRQRALLQGREQLRVFSEALQGCRSLEEAQQVIAVVLPDLVGVANGALALQNASRVYLEVVNTWGDTESPSKPVFEPADCYGLRRGRAVWCVNPLRELCCPHLEKSQPVATVCHPLSAHNQILGCLVLWGDGLSRFDEEQRDLLGFACETLSVVLANLRLAESLRFQAVMDPLTGLYNRRHMEVSLERELARAKRSGETLAVVMMDIDHFKAYNDSEGHDAADAVLGGVGQLLVTSTRAEDVACRYGGEEFLVVLPGIGLESALDRANQVRINVEQMRLKFRGKALPGVTCSLGVALYPIHGASSEELIHAGDQALYRAKRGGRNRVEVPDGGTNLEGR